MPARILVGSCSWTDPTLIACGRFYPAGVTSAEARLRYYAGQFPIVEVDSTYYAPPSARNSALWAARTPPGFVFDVKAYGLLTDHPARRRPCYRTGCASRAAGERSAKTNAYAHDFAAAGLDRLWKLHREALEPLPTAGKLGAVLFQFPPWFVRSPGHADYLRAIAGAPAGLTAGRGVPRRRLDGGGRPPPARSACSRRPGSPTSASTSPRASAPARRRSSPPPRRSPSCASTDATPRRGSARPGRRATASSTCTATTSCEEWVASRARARRGRRRPCTSSSTTTTRIGACRTPGAWRSLLGAETLPPQRQLALS